MTVDDFGHPVFALKRFDDDRRVATVIEIAFGRARLTIASSRSMVYTDVW